MASRTRERRVIAAVPCPACGAEPGRYCSVNPKTIAASRGRPIVHSERRRLWQQRRKPQACSICGYIPSVDSDETVEPSDILSGAPLTCWLCDEIAELQIELERLRNLRDARIAGAGDRGRRPRST